MSDDSLDNNKLPKLTLMPFLKNTFILLSLIYLVSIPLGLVDKDQKKLESPEIQILIILVIATSGLLEDIKCLSVNKNGIKLETIKEIQEIQEKQKKQEEWQQKQKEQEKNNALALESVDLQLSQTILVKKSSVSNLKSNILKASLPICEYIFDKARETRKYAKETHKKGLIERTIPIFEALIKTEYRQEKHRFYAQLGYAYKDQEIPNWEKAQHYLEEAIKKWEEDRQHEYEGLAKDKIELPPHYCFNWIICTLMLENEKQSQNRSYQSDKKTQNNIVHRIKFVNQCEKLAKDLNLNDSLKKWQNYNPDVKIETFQDELPNKCYLPHEKVI